MRLLSLDHDLRLLCNWWLVDIVSENLTGWPTDVSFHILPEQVDFIHTWEGITSTQVSEGPGCLCFLVMGKGNALHGGGQKGEGGDGDGVEGSYFFLLTWEANSLVPVIFFQVCWGSTQ